jgi:hypothetical protein
LFPQAVCPLGQVVTHAPAEQSCPAAQALLQAPQLAASFLVSTHLFPHLTRPASQTKPQPVAVHVAVALAGAVHTRPQPPQWSGSVFVSTQPAPHAVNPPLQLVPHLPAVHVACPLEGAGHLFPQAPQCSTFACASTQAAPHWVRLPQLVPQAPLAHTEPVGQALPHLP